MNHPFRINEYELQAQRHIYPLYVPDETGGYQFSSTMTFLKFHNYNFCVFAAHALPPNGDDLNKIGMLMTDGKFMSLSEVEVGRKICRNRDLAACRTEGPFEFKNYFDLNATESSTEFSEHFSWIGFPQKKAIQKIHRTKASQAQIQDHLSDGVDGLQKWNNAEFLLIDVEFESESEKEIIGVHTNKNVNYTHAGFKQQGHSLKGMSGGALFRSPKKINENPQHLSDIFQFLGIGLEFDNKELITGASRYSVQSFLEEMING